MSLSEARIEKPQWPFDLAEAVAEGLMDWLRPHCAQDYLQPAGSLRRGKLLVGDVELLYVPKTGPVRKPGEFFESESNLADLMIDGLLREGKLRKRPNKDGIFAWGPLNKLGIHTGTGIPVDLFATTVDNWFVSLVIRTGPKELNIRLIEQARQRGLQLHAYGAFTEISNGNPVIPTSEREVFELCGVPWLEPEERDA